MSLQLAKANAKVLPVRSRIATSVCPLACFRSTMTLKRHNDTSLASKRARTVAAAATPGPTESPYPASFNIRGMLCTDHEFTVPLDHDGTTLSRRLSDSPSGFYTVAIFPECLITPARPRSADPQGPSITIFARELLPSTGKPPSNVLFFLQGGPGFEVNDLSGPTPNLPHVMWRTPQLAHISLPHPPASCNRCSPRGTLQQAAGQKALCRISACCSSTNVARVSRRPCRLSSLPQRTTSATSRPTRLSATARRSARK